MSLCSRQQCVSVSFPYVLTNICSAVCFLGDDHADRSEADSYCTFNLPLLVISDVEHFLKCLLVVCISYFESCLSSSIVRFSVVCFFGV